jgi:hypothetical protein
LASPFVWSLLCDRTTQLAGQDGGKMVWGLACDIPGAVAIFRSAVASGMTRLMPTISPAAQRFSRFEH